MQATVRPLSLHLRYAYMADRFTHLLSQRGFYGKVLFDHEERQLVLEVQTDELEKAKAKGKGKAVEKTNKVFNTIAHMNYTYISFRAYVESFNDEQLISKSAYRCLAVKNHFRLFACCFPCGMQWAVLLEVCLSLS